MEQGLKHADIGKQLGRTKAAVGLYAQSIGLASKQPGGGRRWTPQEDERLLALYQEKPIKQVAEQLGRTYEAVCFRLKKVKPKSMRGRARNSWKQEDNDRLRALVASGKSAKQVGQEMGRTASSITNRMNILGVHSFGPTGARAKPLGSEARLSTGIVIRKVKTARTSKRGWIKNWKRVDVIDWEAIYGPVPEGYTLCANSAHLPRTPDNLQLVKKEDLCRHMTGHYLPKEVKELLQIQRQIERVLMPRKRSSKKR